MSCETLPTLPAERAKTSGEIIAPVWLVLLVVFGLANQCQRWVIADQHALAARRLDGSDAQSEVGRWFGLVSAAMVTKLTASTDDVVWLLPFMTQNRVRNVVFYLGCMQLVVLISWAFSAGGQGLMGAIMPKDSSWSLEKVLNLISAVLLATYTIKLFREWLLERMYPDSGDEEAGKGDGEATGEEAGGAGAGAGSAVPQDEIVSVVDEEAGAPSGNADSASRLDQPPVAPDSTGAASPAAPDPQPGVAAEPPPTGAQAAGTDRNGHSALEKYTLRRLFTISMFGSLDDFAVFVSFLLSGLFSGPQLLVGVFLGSSIVVIVCLSAGSFSCVVRIVEKVPLWVIIGAFATWTFISTFAFS